MTGVDSNPFKLAVKATDLCPELCEVPAARRSESLSLLAKQLTRQCILGIYALSGVALHGIPRRVMLG